MIISTLGLYSSGSTWIFNVVRSIIANYNNNSYSIYCDYGMEFISKVNQAFDNIVIKSHNIDSDMINILRISNAKIIISVRDPRDSVTSLMKRFGTIQSDAITQISKSSASIAAARASLGNLFFVYENDFFNKDSTIDRISKFIGVKISKELREKISIHYKKDAIKSWIAHNIDSEIKSATFDPATHWHSGHVSDGEVGKWKGIISEPIAQAIQEAFAPLYSQDGAAGYYVKWLPHIFHFSDGRSHDQGHVIATGTSNDLLVYGPYFHLPPGRWRADFHFRLLDPALTAILKIDVILGYEKGMLGTQSVRLSGQDEQVCGFEFEHSDFLHPLEARIHAIQTGTTANIAFLGVTLVQTAPAISGSGQAMPIKAEAWQQTA